MALLFTTIASMTVAASAADFDWKAAQHALDSVPFKDCGPRLPASVDVFFAPTGDVVWTKARPDVDTAACVEERFRSLRIPPFDGDARGVHYLLSSALYFNLLAPAPPLLPKEMPLKKGRPLPMGYPITTSLDGFVSDEGAVSNAMTSTPPSVVENPSLEASP